MNLFRSEEHIRNWTRFDPAAGQGILPLQDVAGLFSGTMFRRRLDPDYVSHRQEYIGDFLAALTKIGQTRPFWNPGSA